jgi:hypothetical protein
MENCILIVKEYQWRLNYVIRKWMYNNTPTVM